MSILVLLLASYSVAHSNLPVDKFPSILAVYQNWGECDDNTYTAVQSGANVVIWFSVSLSSDSSGDAAIVGGPNLTCVEEKITHLSSIGYGRDSVKHIISVGGWDSPHPNTTHSAKAYFKAFETFNSHSGSGRLFDGLDWDLEGNDALSSPWNVFTAPCLELMADLSKLLHDAGYVVSMAPPESYLDVQTSEFSKFVNLTYPDDVWPADGDKQFSYHGRNVYAYPLAKYPDAFDFISVQIYETKSHASFNTTILDTPQVDYLASYMKRLLQLEALRVDFSHDDDFSGLGVQTLDIRDKFVIGLFAAKGVGAPITAVNATEAYKRVASTLEHGKKPVRGFMYWCMAEDPTAELIATLNKVLNIR